MTEFLTANLGTIIVAALLAAVLIAIVLKLRKDKRKGKGCCGNCALCAECAEMQNVKCKVQNGAELKNSQFSIRNAQSRGNEQ